MNTYSLEHHTVAVDDGRVRLHVVQAGPSDGPLLVLLHGFPEFWYGWHHQIMPLAEAGYRVWAPDQRGYNLSDKPADLSAYAIDRLAADVVDLIRAAGRDSAVVVGHDWGAAVAWWTAATYPQHVARLVVLNVPHPHVMKRYASRRPGQMLRSWYIGFFQLPRLPEWLASLGNWWVMARTLRNTSRPGTFSDADIAHYKTAWSRPGPNGATAFRSMVNWYRAALRRAPKRDTALRITVPTLIIWGVHDPFLMRQMAHDSLALCDDAHVVYFDNATHWVQHEEWEAVNELIIGK